jgi:S1-C subfamily serine protease
MKKATAIFLAVILAFLNGCQNNTGVSIKIPPTTTTPIITDGISKPDPFPGFQIINHNTKDVYGCVGHVHSSKGNFIGSGVLIGPAVVLTAGHVVDGNNLQFFITKDKCYIIEKTILHPQYKTEENILNDLAIIVLSEACDEVPAEIIHSKEELTKREDLTTVGFSHEIKKVSKPGTFWYYGTTEEEPQYMKFLPLKGHIWFGDSGGAVFEDGGHLAGIISYMTILDDTLIEQSAIRLDLYADWILNTMEHEGCSLK